MTARAGETVEEGARAGAVATGSVIDMDALLDGDGAAPGTRESIDTVARWVKVTLAQQRKEETERARSDEPSSSSRLPSSTTSLSERTTRTVLRLITAGLDASQTAVQGRAQAVLRSVIALDSVISQRDGDGGRQRQPSAALDAELIQPALAQPEARRSLLVLEVVVDAFGTGIFGSVAKAHDVLAAVVGGLASADGTPRKCAAVMVSIVKASYPAPTHAGASFGDLDWIGPLLHALCASTEVGRVHVREFVMPALYDHSPSLFRLLCRRLLDEGAPHATADGVGLLRGLLALCKAARQRGLCRVGYRVDPESEVALASMDDGDVDKDAVVVVPTSLVELCILSADVEVSTGALTLIAQSNTTSSPFHAAELRLLLRYFEANLAASDAGTRSKVNAMFISVSNRLRLSTYACARTLAKLDKDDASRARHKERTQLQADITEARSFLESFVRLCCQSLWPGASYPTMLSSLNYLDLLLTSKLDPSFDLAATAPSAARDLVTEPVKSLQKSLKNNPQAWPFEMKLIDAALVKTLLSCFGSTFEDVRNLARRLLLRFPTPLPGLSSDGQDELLRPARRLMLAPRASDAGTGTALLQLYGQLYAGQPLLESLFEYAEEQVAFAEQQGLTAAASEHPLHGCLWALQQVVVEDATSWSSHEAGHIQEVFERTRTLVDRVWRLVKPILSSEMAAEQADEIAEGDEEQGQPDLELARAIALAGGEDGSAEDAASAGPFKHQVLLSYGWRSMKEVSALVRLLVNVTLVADSNAMDKEAADQIGQRFLEWMTQIRHRGAFSIIYPELAATAAALVSSRRNDLATLPRQWLDSLSAQISSRDRAFSTTRRSAGLSYAVLALLQAFQDQPKLFSEVVTGTAARFLEEANRLQREDEAGDAARQVHLFNILRILTLDGRVGPQLLPLVGDLIRLAVTRFQSTSWDLNNVAMLIFSSTISRSFASRQQQNKDDALRRPPFARLFAASDGLAEFLVDELVKLGAEHGRGASSESTSSPLFALLSFIAQFQAGAQDADSDVRLRFREAIASLVMPSHTLLRDIAARAYASTVTVEAALPLAVASLVNAQQAEPNEAHSNIVRAHRLAVLALQAHHIAVESAPVTQLIDATWTLLQRMLGPDSPAHDIAVEAALGIWRTIIATGLASPVMLAKIGPQLCQLCRQWLYEADAPGRASGRSTSLATCALALLDLADEGGDVAELRELLRHSESSVRETALRYIQANVELLRSTHGDALMQQIFDVAQDRRLFFTERILAMGILSTQGVGPALQDLQSITNVVVEDLLWEAWDTPCVPLREHLIELTASLIGQLVAKGPSAMVLPSLTDAIRLFAEIVCRASDEDESLVSRLAAIRALHKLDALLFDPALIQSIPTDGALLDDLFTLQVVAIRMVEDDDEDVRLVATQLLANFLPTMTGTSSAEQPLSSTVDKMGAALACCGGSPQTAKCAAWSWLRDTYADASVPVSIRARWDAFLWAHILPQAKQIERAFDQAFKKRTALFAIDEPNQYRDKTSDVLLAARLCVSAVTSPSSSCATLITQDRERLFESLLRFGELLADVRKRPELGDASSRYVLGLRLVLAARILAAKGEPLPPEVRSSMEVVKDELALGYVLDTL